MLKTMMQMSALALALSFAGASYADEVSFATGGYARFGGGTSAPAPAGFVGVSNVAQEVSIATGGYARFGSGTSAPTATLAYVGASYSADEVSFATGGYARFAR